MDKLEKVIKGLECCIEDGHCYYLDKCPYRGEPDGCNYVLNKAALELLKAQSEEISALRRLVEWAEECGFGLDNILWREYVTEEELDSIDGYVEQMLYVARKAVNSNA